MKMSKNKGVIIGFLMLLAVIGIAGVKFMWKTPMKTIPSAKASVAVSSKKLMTKEQIQADAKQLVSTVESVHPAFTMDAVPKNYEKTKQNFLSDASIAMTADDFSWLARKYLSSLEDLHTSLEDSGLGTGEHLDISWESNGNKLYLLDKNGNITNQQVTEINGVPVEKIFEKIAQYFPAENETGVQFNQSQLSVYKNILSHAGVPCNATQVPVTVKSGNTTTVEKYGFTTKPSPYGCSDSDPIASCKMIGDVFYVDLNFCQPDKQLDSVIAQLKQKLSKGIKKVVIDVRNNPGGDEKACDMLLQAMDMQGPLDGYYTRYSVLAQKQCPHEKKQSGFCLYNADTSIKRNPKISLDVITNLTSCSAATDLDVWVQDGKLGKVIGSPSINSPNYYADLLEFQLTNTGVKFGLSHSKYTRADTKADPKTFHPDIFVPDTQDSLQVALKYLESVK